MRTQRLAAATKEQRKIPYLTLTMGQQGGRGYPPVIVKLERWYAIDDSRRVKPPEELRALLEKQRMWDSPYTRNPMRFWHRQEWVWKKWHNAPRLIWAEVLERVRKWKRPNQQSNQPPTIGGAQTNKLAATREKR